VYAARVALEVIVLLAMLAGLALVPWFRHEPALARFAIAAVPCGISAATVATMRRLGPQRGSRTMTGASELRDRGRAAAGPILAVTKPGVSPERHRRPPDTGVRCRLCQQIAHPPNLEG
jgi:hypothetical protein